MTRKLVPLGLRTNESVDAKLLDQLIDKRVAPLRGDVPTYRDGDVELNEAAPCS